ncbi:MAG: YebC/PmpR family DNA-binding transcriptional regulator [bacterium]
MSGHSKWSTIKHKKAKADAARGKLYTKLIREIVVATREGGKDAEGNSRLRAAILTARNANMPNDTVERAIKRGAGEIDGASYEEVTYEGFGPGGVAFFIEATTDNRNRTVAELRNLFHKRGGNLGTDGSVAWMFERKGVIRIDKEDTDFDRVFEAALEAGAADVTEDEAHYAISTEFTDLHDVSRALEAAGFAITEAKPVRIATTDVAVEGDVAEKILAIMELLDEHDDVSEVFTNADISEEEMERLSAN